MSGHSKWAQIKHQKAASDAKKGKIFSKMGRLIALAAKKGADPASNATLRDVIAHARAANMPSDNIDRAVKKGSGGGEGANLEEVRYEAYGPGGAAIIMEGITDNKNRTSNDIKHTLTLYGAKMVEPGSVLWAFEKDPGGAWNPKTPLKSAEKDIEQLNRLTEALEEQDDVQAIYTNAAS